jgi:hypothetical protein
MLGSAVLLALSVGPATAGPCTSEIDKLTQVLMARNADTSMPPVPTRMSQLLSTTTRETTGSAPASSEAEHGTTGVPGPEAQGTGASAPPSANRGRQAAALNPNEDIFASHMMAGAMSSLERARLLDREGKESDCLSAVGMAKLMSGLR